MWRAFPAVPQLQKLFEGRVACLIAVQMFGRLSGSGSMICWDLFTLWEASKMVASYYGSTFFFICRMLFNVITQDCLLKDDPGLLLLILLVLKLENVQVYVHWAESWSNGLWGGRTQPWIGGAPSDPRQPWQFDHLRDCMVLINYLNKSPSGCLPSVYHCWSAAPLSSSFFCHSVFAFLCLCLFIFWLCPFVCLFLFDMSALSISPFSPSPFVIFF